MTKVQEVMNKKHLVTEVIITFSGAVNSVQNPWIWWSPSGHLAADGIRESVLGRTAFGVSGWTWAVS